jgi:hypothetical protein
LQLLWGNYLLFHKKIAQSLRHASLLNRKLILKMDASSALTTGLCKQPEEYFALTQIVT